MSAEAGSYGGLKVTAAGIASVLLAGTAIFLSNLSGSALPSAIAVASIILGVIAWRGGRRTLATTGIALAAIPVAFWAVFSVIG